MRRVPELDALRGLAATAILVFHLKPGAFPIGWTGVDLFFVLSGYLITSIILRHGDSPRFLAVFYVRRGLRIWPIYYVALAFLVAINPLLPRSSREPLGSLPYYLTYTQNITLYWSSRAPAPMPAFDHTWTLALEEQFYLIWPALVLLVGRKRIIPICIATIALAVAARDNLDLDVIHVWNGFSERLLIARCDGFALGGLLAALLGGPELQKQAKTKLRVGLAGAFAAGALYILWGYLAHGNGFLGLPTPERPASTILAVGITYFGLVGLVASLAGHPWLAPLRNRGLVYLGKISYGIYLYHYIIYWFLNGFRRDVEQPWPVNLEKIALTFLVASISWHLIEAPILRLKDRFGYEGRLTPAKQPAAIKSAKSQYQ